jgi:FKBP-type peptidyl-prolyl cis-trans isomerase SlpA
MGCRLPRTDTARPDACGVDDVAAAVAAARLTARCRPRPVESRIQSIRVRDPAVNTVQPGSFLTLHYRLSGPDGADVVSTFGDNPATLSLGAGQLAPAIEALLVGLPEGAHRSFELPAGAAFGDRNPALLQRVTRALLREQGDPDADSALGDVVRFPTPDGQGSFAGVVRECGDDWLLFDFNHPLAGQPVRFEVQLLGVL